MIYSKRNLRHNRSVEKDLPCGVLLNGQGMGRLSQMRYGVSFVRRCGCECIAVYNALAFMKKKVPLSEVIFRMERYGIIFGLLGSSPFCFRKVMKHFDAEYTTEDFSGEAYIVSFWTKKPFLSAIHTVFCVENNGAVTVYNRYNNLAVEKIYSSLGELTHGRKPVSVYRLKKSV